MTKLLLGLLLVATASTGAVTLPPAGLTPASPFYFLDTFGEWVQEIFAFSDESKAQLQITFAAERLSEMRLLSEGDEDIDELIEKTGDRLDAHLAKALDIVSEENDGVSMELRTRVFDQAEQLTQELILLDVALEAKSAELPIEGSLSEDGAGFEEGNVQEEGNSDSASDEVIEAIIEQDEELEDEEQRIEDLFEQLEQIE